MAQLVLTVRTVTILLKNKKLEIIKIGAKCAYAMHIDTLFQLPRKKVIFSQNSEIPTLESCYAAILRQYGALILVFLFG